MQRLADYQRLTRAALLGAAMILATGQHALAQDTADALGSPPASAPAAVGAPPVVAAPTAVPQIDVFPALDNPPQPGDAFPTAPWGNTE
ncbi:MAG TPA: hypothetical protein VK066_13845 [Chloroflexota bacterium]|nr:hypothetical protein [Chloroflexota bacterium]